MLEIRSDGQLILHKGGREIAVSVKRCFPWSEPTKYFSIRDGENQEVHLVHSIGDLEAGARSALLRALEEEGFCFRVTEIVSIDEEFEVRNWLVQTAQGRRRFQTRLQDWPEILVNGAVMVRDLSGDIYMIDDPRKLSHKGQELLWAFME